MARTLDLSEAAEFLKISPTTCQAFAHSGELPGCKIGISWVFLEEELVRYLKSQTEAQQRERLAKNGIEKRIADGGSVKDGRRQRRRGPLPELTPCLGEKVKPAK